MDYQQQLDGLAQRAAGTLAAVRAASAEDRLAVGARIEQAQGDIDLALKGARLQLGEATDSTHGLWARLKADAGSKLDDLRSAVSQRRHDLDADAASAEADWAEADAFDAIDYAEWAVDNARLAVLDAIDARLRAVELASPGRPNDPHPAGTPMKPAPQKGIDRSSEDPT